MRIKLNIESQAKKDADKLQNLFRKNDQREKQAKDYQRALKEEAKMKRQKHEMRRTQAKDFVNKSYIANEQKGLKNYVTYIRDIENRQEEEKKRERQWSFIEYENYKKKYENSMNNYSVFYEKIKVSSSLVDICRKQTK